MSESNGSKTDILIEQVGLLTEAVTALRLTSEQQNQSIQCMADAQVEQNQSIQRMADAQVEQNQSIQRMADVQERMAGVQEKQNQSIQRMADVQEQQLQTLNHTVAELISIVKSLVEPKA